MSARFHLPLYDEPDLPWSYFLLKAAGAGREVPLWTSSMVAAFVACRLGLSIEKVDEDHLLETLGYLPADPTAMLGGLLKSLEMELPSATSPLRLTHAEALGFDRPVVSQIDLMHDVAVLIQADYGRENFFACFEAGCREDDWDARGAIAVAVYCLLMLCG